MVHRYRTPALQNFHQLVCKWDFVAQVKLRPLSKINLRLRQLDSRVLACGTVAIPKVFHCLSQPFFVVFYHDAADSLVLKA
jgi:hypothetical protein